MHDPFAWSFPLGRLFGITIRIHWLFPFIVLGWILHSALYNPYPAEFLRQNPKFKAPEGIWIDACILMAILFVSVLLHEFGHCFAARWMGGDSQEVLLWPLGGLANVELPNRPQAHLVTAAGGPAVNLLLIVLCTVGLLFAGPKPIQPPWNPLPGGYPARNNVLDEKDKVTKVEVRLRAWDGEELNLSPYDLPVWLARAAWMNWFLSALNLILVGFPLDGGRILQAALWPSMGYRQATLTAVFAGFVVVFVVGLYGLIFYEVLALCLAAFIFIACQRQWVVLEMGGEEGIFGYDFSQGYTSLERDQIQAPAKPRVSWWRRWLQKRAAKKTQREQERREAEERRLDALLDKVHREGRQSLTDEEERFMKRVSDRYKRK